VAEINKLNGEGEKQAQETAEKLYEATKDKIKKGNVVVVSSDSKRAVDTARFFVRLVKERTGIKLKIKKEEWARERNYGDFFRLVAEFFNNRHKKSEYGWGHLLMQAANTLFSRPKGGESFLDVLIRSKALLEKLNEKYKGKTVFLFGHGEQSSAIRTLVADPSIVGSQGYVQWRKKMLNNADFRFFPKSKNQQAPDRDIIIQEVENFMQEKLGPKFARNIHHGLQHSVDLLEKARKLADMLGETGEVDWKVLTAAIYLHDLFADRSEYHGRQAAEFVDENFKNNPIFTQHQINKIKQAVIFHDKKVNQEQTMDQTLSLEAKILYDVDNLDAFGIKGIYRYFAAHISRGLEKNRTNEEMLSVIKQKVATNVQKRLDNLYFDESREIAKNDFPLTKMFFDKLAEEDYHFGTRKGASGVFTFIRENFIEMPWDIADKAESYFKAREKAEDEQTMFTRLYFKRLKQNYADVRTDKSEFEDLLAEFFQFTTKADKDFLINLIEISI
jgi:broad specificity phosphatase PhoE/HD superfamily phosphodiesterase